MFGLTGLVAYAISLAVQLLMFPALSISAYKNLPQTNSLPHSIRTRFGAPLEVFTLLVMLLTGLTSLTGEYIALVRIFNAVLGIDARIILGIAAAVSIYYICYGGALVSLFTEQLHGPLGFLTLVMVVYYYATSPKDVSTPPSRSMLLYGFDKEATQWTYLGSMFFTTTTCAFYEMLWQKHICCRVKKDLYPSCLMAAVLVLLASVVFGVPGMMASWKGKPYSVPYSLLRTCPTSQVSLAQC
jgi:Na+/proline symporter